MTTWHVDQPGLFLQEVKSYYVIMYLGEQYLKPIV